MWLALGILAVTIVLIALRPFRISEGTDAISGMALMLVAQIVTVTDVYETFRQTAEVLGILFGMMVISGVVDEAGFFRWAACRAASSCRGDRRRLYLNTFLLGALVTTVVSNDATALIITPIILATVLRLGLHPLPFLLTCTFVADTASLSLPVSNLTNLLVFQALDLPFVDYLLAMALPSLAAIVVNYWVFRALFRKELTGPIPTVDLTFSPPLGRPFFTFSIALLSIVMAGYLLASALGFSLLWVSSTGALAAGVGARLIAGIPLSALSRKVSWNIFFFVLGMFVIVSGLAESGVLTQLSAYLLYLAGDRLLPVILVVSGSTALGSNLINNVPMDMVMITMLSQNPLPSLVLQRGAAYATILGAGLGPNLTVVGSLATMLWLATVRKAGIPITALQYARFGLIVAPLMILAASLALWVSLLIIH